jgi:TPR repeat protein
VAHSGSSPADTAVFLKRARDQIRRGDIAAARRLLERVADSDEQALFALAETYDPETLARWGAIGIKANAELARALYEKAAAMRGRPSAREHLLPTRE